MSVRVLSFVSLIVLLGAGCQNSTPAIAQAKADTQRAVVVDYPNGGGTTVFLPSADNSEPVMLCTDGTEACPECKAAAIKYFQTGVLDPHCSRTGATRTLAIPSTPSIGHN